MLKKFLCAIALVVAAQGQGAQAQQQVRVTYPDGSVRFETAAAPAAAAAPAPAGTKTVSGVSCCPCNGGTGNCTPACRLGINEPEINSNCPDGTTVCTDIPVELGEPLVPTTVEEMFYDSETPHRATVTVPGIEIRTTERCEFKRHTYMVDCCEITVCVPCRSCKTTSKRCVPKRAEHDILVKLRKDGTYDVFVLNVPGMPKQWLLVMAGTKLDVKTATGIDIP